jgi:hypothetical protein
MASPRPFDRTTLEQAFTRLGELAVGAGKIVEISVYGGSALILTLDGRPATRDVDAVFETDRAFIRSASAQIANDFGWAEDWLNDGVKGFLSAADESPDAKRLLREYPGKGKGPSGLRVFVASAPYLFAMKCLAMRTGGVDEKRDIEDIRRLAAAMGVRDSEGALAVVARYYPEDRLSPKTRFGLEEIFGPEKQ